MEIVYIRECEGKGAYNIGVRLDDGNIQKYSVMKSHLTPLALSQGTIITDELLDRIKEADECYNATRVALKLLSYGTQSPRGLYLKLLSRKISKSGCEAALRYVISCGYINEEGDIREAILRLANNELYGEGKIVARLVARHYKRSMVERILGELIENGEIDPRANARRLIEKKLGDTLDTEKIKGLLYKYGYKITEE